MVGTIGVGTPHNIERIKVGTRLAGMVGGLNADRLCQYHRSSITDMVRTGTLTARANITVHPLLPPE